MSAQYSAIFKPMFVGAALLVCATSDASALDKTVLEICREHYATGNRDITSSYSDVEKVRVYLSALCSIEAGDYQGFAEKSKHLKASGDTSYGLFKIKANAKDNYSTFKSELKAACDKKDDSQFLREIARVSSSLINPAVGEQFNNCVKTLADLASSQGKDSLVTTFLLQGADGKRFDLFLTASSSRSSDELVVSGVSPSDKVKCWFGTEKLMPGNSLTMKSNRTLKEFVLECERAANEEVTVTVAADGLVSQPRRLPVVRNAIQDLKDSIADLVAEHQRLRVEHERLNSSHADLMGDVKQIKEEVARGLDVTLSPPGIKTAVSTYQAICAGGRKVVGGSCISLSGNVAIQNAGISGNGWSCVWVGEMPRADVYALCAR